MRWIVLFDWDGTLIDSLDIKVRNSGILFEQVFGWSPASVENAYRRYSGIARQRLFEAICFEHGLPHLSEERYRELSNRFTSMNREILLNVRAKELLFTDTVSTLCMLEKLSYPLYVSSSADPIEIRMVAERLEIHGYFIRSGGELLGSSPGFNKGKQHIEYALLQHNLSLSNLSKDHREWNVAFVGDEPADILLGRQAGVIPIAKTGTYPAARLAQEKPDHIIASLNELPSLLNTYAQK
jgi:phosphoglycolate phosphatase-like HAD superfamily hydrolase